MRFGGGGGGMRAVSLDGELRFASAFEEDMSEVFIVAWPMLSRFRR